MRTRTLIAALVLSDATAGWYQFWVDETDPYAPAFQELRNAFEQLKP